MPTATTQALIESYWAIGQRIHKEKLNTQAGYHNAILTDLNADLDIGLRTLQRTVTFYRSYKRPPRVKGLDNLTEVGDQSCSRAVLARNQRWRPAAAHQPDANPGRVVANRIC